MKPPSLLVTRLPRPGEWLEDNHAGTRYEGPRFEISPREREDEEKRDDRDFGTQEYDDDANRPDQRETRRDYED